MFYSIVINCDHRCAMGRYLTVSTIVVDWSPKRIILSFPLWQRFHAALSSAIRLVMLGVRGYGKNALS